jgi:O-methyltransferase
MRLDTQRLFASLNMGTWRRSFRWLLQEREPQPALRHPSDIDTADPRFRPLANRVRSYTMTSDDKMYALYGATHYIARAGIPGDIVECGVWRGGSSMLAALTLQEAGQVGRAIWLYDTFDGMPPPSERDNDRHGVKAADVLCAFEREAGVNNPWAYATLADVQQNMAQTQYPTVNYVVGKVEDTIPDRAPARISLLRLDTDWYESTRHELEHLYPRLESGGILLIDDYGWWSGARQAVDEYFAQTPVFLARVGTEGGRIAVKP